MFFPLGRPTTWRVIAMSSRAAAASRRESGSQDQPIAGDLSLAELQAVIDGATGGGVRVHSLAWMTHFRLHHRQAAHYRRGRVFVAGDAAHIHSSVGAQGMNTGIQDAWNLGWKLALVARGAADALLLDTYEAERWPVGRTLLRFKIVPSASSCDRYRPVRSRRGSDTRSQPDLSHLCSGLSDCGHSHSASCSDSTFVIDAVRSWLSRRALR